MNSLTRNKQAFYYCNYNDTDTPILDENGYETGEYIRGYGEAVKAEGNISEASGTWQAYMFGRVSEYERTIVIAGECDIEENAALFIGIDVAYDDDGQPLNNYYVKRKAVSLNSTTLLIGRTNAS